MNWTGPILAVMGWIVALAGLAVIDRNRHLGTYIAGFGAIFMWFGMLASFLFGIFFSPS